ncbi:peptidase [Clostridium sp. MSJ-11]|uniref:Peptidase n=1 Tax=Clostridium mobile TaxID=2841512 RepID=A0ABS6EI40_9CLOT|nr:GDSL-type esterase/lipase family protein [Clostridium mobile]MBU5484812.1 peptidase [Clostridium mobile]
MKLVCFGDSLTYGYGVSYGECWCDIIKEVFKIPVTNKGLNGDTTAGMLFRSYKDVICLHPTHCIIMGGTNDFLLNASLDNTINNIILIIQECKENNIIPLIGIQPPVHVSLANKYWDDSIDYSKVNSAIEIYRENIIDYSNINNITYFDFYASFTKNPEINPEVLSNLYTDGIHPTFEGHKIMARTIKF